jgi:hypothetical protein
MDYVLDLDFAVFQMSAVTICVGILLCVIITCALYARRGGAEVTVIHKGLKTGALGKAELIENYYGLETPVSGAELERRGIEGARALGV